MKQILNVIYFLFISISLFSQDLGTIELNKDYAATLKFPDNIETIILGNNPVVEMTADGNPICKFYDIFQSKKVAIFRAKTESPPKTTLTVTLNNGEVYTGFICYSNKPEKTFYNYDLNPKALSSNNTSNANENSQEKTEVPSQVTENLKKLLDMKPNIEDIAEISNAEIYQVANLANDDKYTYIKIVLVNNSASKYIIDGIMFKYTEGKKNLLSKKEVVNENWMATISAIYPKQSSVDAHSKDAIVLAIPLYTTASGYLNIKIIEKEGSRTHDIQISAKEMAKINVFTNK